MKQLLGDGLVKLRKKKWCNGERWSSESCEWKSLSVMQCKNKRQKSGNEETSYI